MRYLIISDLHGSEQTTRKALSYFDELEADKILILGDVLYHGPRNPIPVGYNPQDVVALLNPYKDRILAVRGNCEAEVDQMLLAFPCMGDYLIIQQGEHTLFLTHGHIYNPSVMPELAGGSAFLYGHTHLWQCEQRDGILLFNPGSITLPKENRPATFGFFDGTVFSIRTLEGNEVLSSFDIRNLA